MSSPTASDVKQKLPEYGWKFGNQLSGPLCHVPQSKVHAEISGTKLMESLLPLPFHWEKYARGEKWGEGMRILFGWETKRQTKGDEADSLWRRLLYCKIGAACVCLSLGAKGKKKKIYWDVFTYINIKTQTVNSLRPFSLKQTCKLNQIVHLDKLMKCS